jgi:hypothetical protein
MPIAFPSNVDILIAAGLFVRGAGSAAVGVREARRDVEVP